MTKKRQCEQDSASLVFCQLRQFYLLKFQLCFSCRTTMILPAVFNKNERRFQSTKTMLIIERKKLCQVDPRLSADLSTCWKTEWPSHCSVTCCCVTHGVTRFSPPAKPSSDQLTHPPILTPDNQFTSLDVTWGVIESVNKMHLSWCALHQHTSPIHSQHFTK